MLTHVEMRIICYDWDDPSKIEKRILDLLKGINIKEIFFEKKVGKGLVSSELICYRVKLDKRKHIDIFLKNFLEKLDKEEIEKILKEIDKIVDDEGKLYLRFDKDYFIIKGKLKFVNHGEVLHITLTPKLYKKDREEAKELFKNLLNKNSLSSI